MVARRIGADPNTDRPAMSGTPQMAQPQMIPSPSGVLNTPYERKFQPSDRNRADQASSGAADQMPPTLAPYHIAMPPNRNSPNEPAMSASAEPSGQLCAETYGPPSAHRPPTSMTARMPRNISVRHSASPPIPTDSFATSETSGSCRDAAVIIASPLPSRGRDQPPSLLRPDGRHPVQDQPLDV